MLLPAKYLVYAVIALFSYLIINWGFNACRGTREGIEGSSDKTSGVVGGDKTSKTPASNASAAATSGSKCPEDCTSVKELQKKLSEATKTVATLEENIIANTNASAHHSTAIANLNQSITEMQSKQEDK